MSNQINQNQEAKSQAVPFFARFLEAQAPEESMARPETRKYPSDSEEEVETRKYPSDWEDG
ncbi:MAG: microviridin/marinostatin family tricyclic proteinase inhibitor [Cyanobacteria bacterium SBLK]|nr:microviridin/marinostatin family tricyclic proteinase inhibitor [Cyanobacteria bacterium SBLK]